MLMVETINKALGEYREMISDGETIATNLLKKELLVGVNNEIVAIVGPKHTWIKPGNSPYGRKYCVLKIVLTLVKSGVEFTAGLTSGSLNLTNTNTKQTLEIKGNHYYRIPNYSSKTNLNRIMKSEVYAKR